MCDNDLPECFYKFSHALISCDVSDIFFFPVWCIFVAFALGYNSKTQFEKLIMQSAVLSLKLSWNDENI